MKYIVNIVNHYNKQQKNNQNIYQDSNYSDMWCCLVTM